MNTELHTADCGESGAEISPNRSGRTFLLGCLLAFLASASWGASAAVGRFLYGNTLDAFDPMTVNFYRFLLGTIVLNVFLFCSGRGKEVKKAIHDDWLLLILSGVFGVACEGTFQLWALTQTTAARCTLSGSTSPLFTLILAAVIQKERPGLLRCTGALAAAAGVTMLFFCEGGDLYGTNNMRLGDVLAVCSSVSWSLYTVIMSRISKKYDGLICTAVMMPIGTLLLFPIACFRGGMTMPLTPGFCVGVLYLGVVACGLSYLCWAQAGKYLSAATLGSFGFVQLILSLLLSVMCLHERASWQMAVCLAVILSGTVLMVKRKSVFSVSVQKKQCSRRDADGSGGDLP